MIMRMNLSEFVKLVNLSTKAENAICDWDEYTEEYVDEDSQFMEFEDIDELSQYIVSITEEYENKIEDDENESSYFRPERWHNL